MSCTTKAERTADTAGMPLQRAPIAATQEESGRDPFMTTVLETIVNSSADPYQIAFAVIAPLAAMPATAPAMERRAWQDEVTFYLRRVEVAYWRGHLLQKADRENLLRPEQYQEELRELLNELRDPRVARIDIDRTLREVGGAAARRGVWQEALAITTLLCQTHKRGSAAQSIVTSISGDSSIPPGKRTQLYADLVRATPAPYRMDVVLQVAATYSEPLDAESQGYFQDFVRAVGDDMPTNWQEDGRKSPLGPRMALWE